MALQQSSGVGDSLLIIPKPDQLGRWRVAAIDIFEDGVELHSVAYLRRPDYRLPKLHTVERKLAAQVANQDWRG